MKRSMQTELLHRFPYGLLALSTTMVASTVVAVWLTGKIVTLLEVLAWSSVLEKMDDRLSDPERADIEGRLRDRVF